MGYRGIQAKLLVMGAMLWIVSEGMELASGGFNDANSTVSTIAFLLIGLGLGTLWRADGQNIVGRIGVALVALGMGLFALVAFQTIGSGLINDSAQSGEPLFLAAGSAVAIGALALSYWLVTVGPFPKIIGVIMFLATLFTLGVAFAPDLVGLQPVSNVVLALILLWLGWASRRG